MKFNDWISLGSLAIALVALGYTYISNTKKYELTSQYRKEILTWYANTVEVLVRLKLEAKLEQQDLKTKKELLSKLSSQIEIGRFYFPNIDKGDSFGVEKPSAYQGYRNLILDFLVYFYSIIQRQDAHKYIKHLDTLERNFTSYLYEILNPREYLKLTYKHTRTTFIQDLSVEEFIEQDPDNIKFVYEAS